MFKINHPLVYFLFIAITATISGCGGGGTSDITENASIDPVYVYVANYDGTSISQYKNF